MGTAPWPAWSPGARWRRADPRRAHGPVLGVAPRGRRGHRAQAADELRSRARGRRRSPSWSTATSTSPTCASSGCAFCGFGVRAAAPRTPTSTTARSSCSRLRGRRSTTGRPRSASSRASTPTGASRTTWAGSSLPREVAPQLHLHAFSPMEVDAHVHDLSGLRAASRCSRGCARPGLGSVPGTAAEVLEDGVRQRISPNKLPAGRWGGDRRAPPTPIGLRSTVTVMFGHVEQPHELAEHMRVVRALQERTGGFTEFVPLSFIPYQTLLGPHPRDRADNARGQPASHTAVFRLALGRTVRKPAGQLGQDGPRRPPPRHCAGGSTTSGVPSWRRASAAWPEALTGSGSTPRTSWEPPTRPAAPRRSERPSTAFAEPMRSR